MSFWAPENLRAVIGGSWLAARPRDDAPAASGVSTDTRTLRAGQVFVALKGPRFDGHAMLGAAASAGASLAIVDDPGAASGSPEGLPLLRVADAGRALLRLAAAYRETLSRTCVIAVCGSNGKTTTVRLLDAVLSRTMRGTSSPKSFNNAIGVPLTILAASPADGYLICEVGTNARGEIAQLARVVRPDVAVITSIGREHLERLGSVREVAREEASVLEFLRRGGPGGGAGVVNADAPHLLEVIATLPERPATLIRFGRGEHADVRVVESAPTAGGAATGFTLNDRSAFGVPLPGAHNAVNAAAAIAVARRLGVPGEAIAAGLASARGPEMRLEVSRRRGVLVVNDAYNANPDSVRAALAAFPDLAAGASRRVLVLGDMLELGEHAASEHRSLGEDVARLSPTPDLVALVGPAMRAAADPIIRALGAGRVLPLDSMDDAPARRLAGELRPGDAVLLKGSRSMRLERLLPLLGDAQPS